MYINLRIYNQIKLTDNKKSDVFNKRKLFPYCCVNYFFLHSIWKSIHYKNISNIAIPIQRKRSEKSDKLYTNSTIKSEFYSLHFAIVRLSHMLHYCHMSHLLCCMFNAGEFNYLLGNKTILNSKIWQYYIPVQKTNCKL